MPRINDIKQEYLTQNTVKYIMGNYLHQTDLDANPSRYTILNGHDEKTDPLLKKWGMYPKDRSAYYPLEKKEEEGTAKLPPTNPEAISRYGGKPIYPLDPKPYFSPAGDYRVLTHVPKDQIAVPIEFGDLSHFHADEKNISALEKELENIDRPESLNSVSATGKYVKDPKAYFDPAVPDRERRKNKLTEQINSMKQDLLIPPIPRFETEVLKDHLQIQNGINKNREETNELIANSYHYPIERSGKRYDHAGPVGNSDKMMASAGKFVFPEGPLKTHQDLLADGSIIGMSAKNSASYSKITPPDGFAIGDEPGSKRRKEAVQRYPGEAKIERAYEEPDVKVDIFAEAEAIGVKLGYNYVDKVNPPRPRRTEVDLVDKKFATAETPGESAFSFNPPPTITKDDSTPTPPSGPPVPKVEVETDDKVCAEAEDKNDTTPSAKKSETNKEGKAGSETKPKPNSKDKTDTKPSLNSKGPIVEVDTYNKIVTEADTTNGTTPSARKTQTSNVVKASSEIKPKLNNNDNGNTTNKSPTPGTTVFRKPSAYGRSGPRSKAVDAETSENIYAVADAKSSNGHIDIPNPLRVVSSNLRLNRVTETHWDTPKDTPKNIPKNTPKPRSYSYSYSYRPQVLYSNNKPAKRNAYTAEYSTESNAEAATTTVASTQSTVTTASTAEASAELTSKAASTTEASTQSTAPTESTPKRTASTAEASTQSTAPTESTPQRTASTAVASTQSTAPTESTPQRTASTAVASTQSTAPTPQRTASTAEASPARELNTQGLKVERVKIIPMRQILENNSQHNEAE